MTSHQRRVPAKLFLGAGLLGLVALVGCAGPSTITDTTAAPDTLMVSASQPPSGDATLDGYAGLSVVDSTRDELHMSQAVGQTIHDVIVVLDHSSHRVLWVNHMWWHFSSTLGEVVDGNTVCGVGMPSACGGTTFSSSSAVDRLHLKDFLMTDGAGTQTCTLDGTIAWRSGS